VSAMMDARSHFLLELASLSKRYGSTVALDDCSFSVQRGRVLGFLGRNGAGKTTAMRSIFGLVDLDQGSIRWDGKSVDRAARARFGYMPEERGLFTRMGAGAQLEFFARLRGLDAAEARLQRDRWLEQLGLSDAGDTPVDHLSHGNQQKVQLGVSLIGDPELLVLDEPFSGLDPIAVEVLSSVIREAAERGCAVVFSSHQLSLVGGVCDDVAIITHGHVVLSGDLDEIRRESPMRTLTVELDTATDSAWAKRLNEQIGGELLSGTPEHVKLSVPADTQIASVFAALTDVDSHVSELHLEPPELEDVFRRVAGEAE
jgi:ABC-2 type transport system ATP-binding protein